MRYVGLSSRGMERPHDHGRPSNLKKRTHVAHWVSELKRVGLDYEVVILHELPDPEILNDAEKFWISYYRGLGCRLTNLTIGGEGTLGWKAPPEFREKRRTFMLGKRYTLGVIPSEETRARMAASHIGKTTGSHSIERRLKNSRSQGGRPVLDQFGNRYETQAEAAQRLGLKQAAVSAVLLGKRTHHHGYEFRYGELA